ncbi:MAG: hypothetical protein DWG80_00045 [Chloroflexi bacterium]|nr:hypothetical protein [Chloroflexota bacterium]
MTSGIAWVDGELVPREEARVSIDDFGFRYGLACFETMLARHGRVFRLAEHLDRLEASLTLFRATAPARTVLRRAVTATLKANALSDASIRLSATPGSGTRPSLPATGSPTVVITVDAVGPPPPPARLWVSSVRLDASRPWRGAKIAQFAPYLLARAEAMERGLDDALLLDQRGHVAEAATSNAFFLIAGVLLTPPLSDGPLPGVARSAILQAAAELRIASREATVTLHDLQRVEAAFLTSSIVGLATVRSIGWEDGGQRHLWQTPGDAPVVASLRDAYERLVEAETAT